MAAGTSEGDAHMEEMVDQGLGMEETDQGLPRRPSLKENYHSDSLLAPDTDFMTDDRSSANSGLDVADRLTYLEQRMQMQEDEIQLLKMALADVLKRLNLSEEHQAAAARLPPKCRPVSLALPSRPSVTSSTAPPKRNSTLPSSAVTRNYSPTPPRSGVRSPLGSVKDSPGKTIKSRPGSAASTSNKTQEGANESNVGLCVSSAGARRVTHCKGRIHPFNTGSTEAAKSAATVPASSRPSAAPMAKGASRPQGRKTTPSFKLNLQKTTNSQNTAQDDSIYKSPIKSPSQYFQICY
uniref:EMAP like 1 n=1 Tax=Mola mola TaxID=94237 RepID=A0A3Q3WB53_MOLML